MALRCVGFDLGGVMVRINFYWSEALASAGFAPKDLGNLVDFPGTNLLGDGSIEFAEYAAGLRAYLGLETDDDAIKVHDAILVNEYAGVVDLVKRIQGAGLTVGCLTNTNPRHLDVCVEKFEVCRTFDRIVASCNVNANKPDEAIYRIFEQHMGVGSNEIVYFDDYEPNVIAANAFGWEAHRIDPRLETVPQIEKALGSRLS